MRTISYIQPLQLPTNSRSYLPGISMLGLGLVLLGGYHLRPQRYETGLSAPKLVTSKQVMPVQATTTVRADGISYDCSKLGKGPVPERPIEVATACRVGTAGPDGWGG